MENWIERSHRLYCEEQVSDVGDSSSNHVGETSSLMMASEVDRLNERLKTLEEEAEVVKQAFLEGMQERKKLMSEIYDKFQIIHQSLLSREQVRGERHSGVLLFNPHKSGRRETGGLSQVLTQESNPSLVFRDLRTTTTTMLTLEEPPAEALHEFSNTSLLPF